MSRVAVVLAALCSACFTKPAFNGGDDNNNGDGGVDGRRDASSTDPDAPDAPTTCSSLYSDTFTTAVTGDPCQPWGTTMPTTSIVISRTNGMLTMSPASMMMGGYGGCESGELNFANGASVRLVQAPTTYYWSSEFRLTPMGSATSTVIRVGFDMVSMQTTKLSMTDHNGATQSSLTYVASDMQWLRFKLTNASTVTAAYSANGSTWMSLGNDDYGTSVGLVTVQLVVSAYYGGQTQWDDLNVLTCPPP